MVLNGRSDARAAAAQLAAQPIANQRVPLHDGGLFGVERTGLEQNRVGNADLPDIVQVAALGKSLEVLVRQSELTADRDTVAREPLTVALGAGITRLDDQARG